MFHQHTRGVSQKDLSRDFKLGKATIERWYHQGYWLKNQQFNERPCPRVLGIDEHFFNRKQSFATTLCDLRKHKVFDIVKGYSSQTLAGYLNQLPGKERVQVVCMDLSSRYRHLVQHYFPKAKIVAIGFM